MKHLFLVLIILTVLLTTSKFANAGEIVFRNGPRSVIVCYPTVYYNTYQGYSSGYSSGYYGNYYGGYYSAPAYSYHRPHRPQRVSRRNQRRRHKAKNYSYYPVKSTVDLNRVQKDRYYLQ